MYWRFHQRRRFDLLFPVGGGRANLVERVRVRKDACRLFGWQHCRVARHQAAEVQCKPDDQGYKPNDKATDNYPSCVVVFSCHGAHQHLAAERRRAKRVAGFNLCYMPTAWAASEFRAQNRMRLALGAGWGQTGESLNRKAASLTVIR